MNLNIHAVGPAANDEFLMEAAETTHPVLAYLLVSLLAALAASACVVTLAGLFR